MAVALGFGQGNKNNPMAGTTGGGAIQAKVQPNGQLGLSTDGSGGMLNYLKGLINPQQQSAASAVAPAAAGASTAAPLTGGGL